MAEEFLRENCTGYLKFASDHADQLKTLGVPSLFWKTLYYKCSNHVFDAGNVFSFEEIDYDDEPCTSCDLISQNRNPNFKVSVVSEDGITPDDSNQIYLIDHAYTYILDRIHCDLLQNDALRQRLCHIMDVLYEERSKESIIKDILHEIWRFNNSYIYADITPGSDELLCAWYIMDELGCQIRHSQEPSFRAVTFFYMQDQIPYTLLYPLKVVNYGDEVTRNFIEGKYKSQEEYNALMMPWKYYLMTFIEYEVTEPSIDFIMSGRWKESLPDLPIDIPEVPEKLNTKLQLYTTYSVLEKNLHHPHFELTFEENKADILWLTQHYTEYKELSKTPLRWINQFPNEHILTSKDLFAAICRRDVNKYILDGSTLQTNPPWLPTTYNLITELPQFVSYFQHRKLRNLENFWICKPWNRARGLDIHITNDINYIIKLRSTGPKVACKYVTDPVLFPMENKGLVKMDLRYIVLLKSVMPLQLYAYKRFWIRFSNKPFSLDSFEDYEKHFTVMNYSECELKQMFCDDFIKILESYYTDIKYKDIEEEIFSIFNQIFTSAANGPVSLFPNTQSRAMYGIDLMLQWRYNVSGKREIQPVILEVNWCPDCQRACDYYPDFFNDVVEVLFLDSHNNSNVVLL